MKHGPKALLTIAALMTALSSPLHAQTAPSSPATTPPAASSPPTAPADDADAGGEGAAMAGSVKAVRQACRADAVAKGLKGSARREAISACVVQKRPDQAGREACRSQGFDKGLRKQELHAFVKDCVKAKG